jgi:uncharacterized repeat protein (TIGR01451 family)
VQFTTIVTNTGNVPLTNVRVTDTYPEGLTPREATRDYDQVAFASSGTLVWVIPKLDRGEAKQFDVLCLCSKPVANATTRATVTADRGVTETGQATIAIQATAGGAAAAPGGPAIPDGQLSLQIMELGDPIRVGEANDYELRITNERSVSDFKVVLRVELPDGLKFEGISGPVAGRKISPDARTIEVSPINEIRGGETLPSFHLSATGIQIGDHRIRVSVTSQLSPQGVLAEETTSVTAQ